MHPPSRARRILKWTGVGLSVIALAIWAASLWCDVIISLSPRAFIGMEHRGIGLVVANSPLSTWFYNPSTLKTRLIPHDMGSLTIVWPHFVHGQDRKSKLRITQVMLPYWLLLLLITIPTAWLWHRDRRRIRPGCCLRCGYDLTGNVSGKCPECGDKACPPAVLADSECGMAKPPPSSV